MAFLTYSGLETHPLGTANPGPIINANWAEIDLLLQKTSLRQLTSTAVNLKTTGNQTIFTNTTGLILLVEHIDIIPTTVTSITGQPTITVGRSAGTANDFVASVALPAMTTAKWYRCAVVATPGILLNPGESVYLDVTTGAVGTSYLANMAVAYSAAF